MFAVKDWKNVLDANYNIRETSIKELEINISISEITEILVR